MKYLDEYRDPEQCRGLLAAIRRTASQRWTIMEVCGGQTHGLLRYGIPRELEESICLIHGPGCPVCVTPLGAIDFAIDLALRPNVMLTSFGDMLRVPGSRQSLLRIRGSGGNIRIVYSPLDAVELARRHPDQQVVFFAVGFETTAPSTAIAVQQANAQGLQNFSLIVSHVCVQPAMEMLAANHDSLIQGFLAAGHVCAVTGCQGYQRFTDKYRLPVVVTGFEPVDLLSGILECVRQLECGEATVSNCYQRSVAAAGNRRAAEIVKDVYEVCDRDWRGLGVVPAGGLRLRSEWEQLDASKRFDRHELPVLDSPTCRSGEILTGQIKPPECEFFGTQCTPETPLGAPMVSAEGACAAYYRYSAQRPAHMDR